MTSILRACFFTCLCLAYASPTLQAADRPNFLLIFVDDLGYSDIGCFGSKLHRTPHIDSLATNGTKFTSFYVTSGVCSPSRSSLLTGCYPRRVNLHNDHNNAHVLFPVGKKGLSAKEITLPEILKQAGYATAMVGKWHLGDQPPFLPTQHGFDSYFGIPYSNDMGHDSRKQPYRYPPLPLMRNEAVIEQEPDQRYITKRYTEQAIQFIKANADTPFFLYLPHSMPHWPQYASENFAGKSQNGKWGDAVEEIDWSTGEILNTLKEEGLYDNTFIVFTSDNGGATQHGASNAPLKAGKGTTFEGGMRVCNVMQWPARIPAGRECDELISTIDLLPTFAAIAGQSEPADRPIDGHDIRPILFNEPGATSPHKAFAYYLKDTLECVRKGPWKLRIAEVRRKSQKPGEYPKLYNLTQDIAETTDVSDEQPEIVAELQQIAEEIRADLGDGATEGANQRESGWVDVAVPLTSVD